MKIGDACKIISGRLRDEFGCERTPHQVFVFVIESVRDSLKAQKQPAPPAGCLVAAVCEILRKVIEEDDAYLAFAAKISEEEAPNGSPA